MRLTKFTHACVRLEKAGRVLVVDPGTWGEPEALAGAEAVLITHAHGDHLDADALAAAAAANPELRVYCHESIETDLRNKGIATAAVGLGMERQVAGFTVSVHGGQHAEIWGGQPEIANLAFAIDGVYHPGDSYDLPGRAIDTLLVPIGGPWVKLAETIDFVRALAPKRAIAIHDATLSERGHASTAAWLNRAGGAPYERLAVGAWLDLG